MLGVKRKVAHIVRKLLPSHVTFIRNQIMSHKAFDVCVISKEYISSDFAKEIVKSHPSLCCDSGKKGPSKLFSTILYRRPFRRLTLADTRCINVFMKLHRPDILHFHYGTDAGVFIDATRFICKPSVVSFYGYDCTSFPKRFFGLGTRYLRYVFKKVNYCLAMSENMKLDLLALGCPEDKVIVHYYGTDVSNFLHKRIYDSKKNFTILIVASLDEKKGHIYLLKSLERLEKSIKSRLHLRIVGSGPLDSELRGYVKSRDLGGVVSFAGAFEYLSEQFMKEFRDADIFAHPSVMASNGDKEGIPGTIVEAMAAGLPVISTYHAGIPYVIQQEETGLLVRERDIDALAASIGRLVLDSKMRRRIGQNARKYALKHLDLRRRQIELENIYDFVIEKHAKKLSRQR